MAQKILGDIKFAYIIHNQYINRKFTNIYSLVATNQAPILAAESNSIIYRILQQADCRGTPKCCIYTSPIKSK